MAWRWRTWMVHRLGWWRARRDDAGAHRAGRHTRSAGSAPKGITPAVLGAADALARQDAAAALTRLEADAVPSPLSRLLLQLVRCQTGQRALAHLELAEWARQEDCPPGARVLLAWLHLDDGDRAASRSVLRAAMRHRPDAAVCQLLALLDLIEQLPHSTRRATEWLTHAFRREGVNEAFASSLDLTGGAAPTAHAPTEVVDQVAVELLQRPRVIRTLCAAQLLKANPARVELLRRALARIVDDLPEPLDALTGLTGLAALAGDGDEARRWARRALKVDPYNARVAMLAAELDLEATAGGAHRGESPDAADLLRAAIRRQPTWPDLRVALIRLYQRTGRTSLAIEQARQWASQHPHQPAAQRILMELAA